VALDSWQCNSQTATVKVARNKEEEFIHVNDILE